MELNELRTEINGVDEELLRLFLRRMAPWSPAMS